MALPSLSGPHILSIRIIDQTITGKVPGVYALNARVGGALTTRRVGRSVDDLATRIKEFVGLYSDFSCAIVSSPKHAYESECELYHVWMPPENTDHPARPDDADWAFPICGR